jgi:predicted transposase/invertase (TIGR01784 family)
MNYMREKWDKYIKPTTDFGFKKLFGTELNKDLLISFLNALFEGEKEISDVRYLDKEFLGAHREDRRAILDIYCEDVNGEKFIVEMQNVYQQFYADSSIYYSTFPIQEQAIRGDWSFELQRVYTIGILNFVFPDNRKADERYHRKIMLMDVKTKEVFSDKLTYIYLELPKFQKEETELETMFDKWMYVLKNLSNLMSRPTSLQERIFERLFEQAEIAKYSREEQYGYEQSIKAYRDLNNAVATAEQTGKETGYKEGLEVGRKEGEYKAKIVMAREMKRQGISVETIVAVSGLAEDETGGV